MLWWGALLLAAHNGQAGPSAALNLPFRFKQDHLRQVAISYKGGHGFIIIVARLNGQGPFNFLLDTGTSASVITDPKVGELLGPASAATCTLAGVGRQAPHAAYWSRPGRLEFGQIEAPALSFVVTTQAVTNKLLGLPLHGILGYDLFRSFVVTIQPRLNQVIFADPAQPLDLQDHAWARLPLTLEGNKACVNASIAVTDSLVLPLKLVVDTGAGHALSLETASDPRLCLPARRTRAVVGHGLSGPITGYLGRISRLQLGCYALSSLLTSFPDSSNLGSRIEVPRNGTLGLAALRRFDIVLDYLHYQLLLRPNAQPDGSAASSSNSGQLALRRPLRKSRVPKSGKVPTSPAESIAVVKPDEELLTRAVAPR
ncbi:hypothetical protein B0919_20005 [Hymenobacter sp. CRA2]|nr:hypothetical protein B0919_20005 [Hymenobacter sp. CRA2]